MIGWLLSNVTSYRWLKVIMCGSGVYVITILYLKKLWCKQYLAKTVLFSLGLYVFFHILFYCIFSFCNSFFLPSVTLCTYLFITLTNDMSKCPLQDLLYICQLLMFDNQLVSNHHQLRIFLRLVIETFLLSKS